MEHLTLTQHPPTLCRCGNPATWVEELDDPSGHVTVYYYSYYCDEHAPIYNTKPIIHNEPGPNPAIV